MWRILATSLAVGVGTGCTVEVQGASTPTSAELEDVRDNETPAPPAAPYEAESEGWPSDPCGGGQAGATYVIAGREVFVPAECDPHYEEVGDPPDVSDP